MPVRLTDARIADHTLTLTVVPLSAKQRQRAAEQDQDGWDGQRERRRRSVTIMSGARDESAEQNTSTAPRAR